MKNKLFNIIAIAVIASACSKKIDTISNTALNSVNATSINATSLAANIGTPFQGSNVLTNINPLNPGLAPLIVFHPNTNSGHELLMVDNGILNTNTPVNAFRFVSVNMDNNSYKIISIKNPSTGAVVSNTVGRISTYTFGMNKKLYVATEGSYGGGGHLIEYDPNTQTASDLGKPFYYGGNYLDIYSLNVGADSALYGGSFGGSGQVMTFRYTYNNQFYTDQAPLDNESRYVDYISGDSRYTYASCGENNWYLYAIDRTTGTKKTILSSTGSTPRITLNTFTNAPDAQYTNTHYTLVNGNAVSLGANNRPMFNQLYYSPYTLEQANTFNISWNSYAKKLSFTNNNVSNSITISDISSDVYPTGAGAWFNNQLYLSANLHPLMATYSDQSNWNVLGNTGIDIYSVSGSAAINATGNKLYIGGYPSGNLYQLNTAQPWTLDGTNIGNYAVQTLQTQTNPQLLGRVQGADAAGVSGPMFISGIANTNNNFIVAGGDNDRITASSGRALAISSYYNNSYKNFSNTEFNQYQFSSMCLSADSNNVYIAASSNTSNISKIYAFNPSSNAITNSIIFPNSTPGQIVLFDKNTIAGTYNDVLYLLDIPSGKIIWQQALGSGQTIFSITKAPNNTICIIHMYLMATHFRVLSFTFTKSNTNTVSANNKSLGEVSDQDNDENTKPINLIFANASTNPNAFDLYISGLKSVYRLKSVITK